MLFVAVSFVFVVVDLMQLSSLSRRQSGNQPLLVVDVDNDGLRPVFFVLVIVMLLFLLLVVLDMFCVLLLLAICHVVIAVSDIVFVVDIGSRPGCSFLGCGS